MFFFFEGKKSEDNSFKTRRQIFCKGEIHVKMKKKIVLTPKAL